MDRPYDGGTMKVYRVHLYDGCEGSAGYKYFTSAKAAAACVREHETEDKEIRCEQVPLTKAGVLWILNSWASHADNG